MVVVRVVPWWGVVSSAAAPLLLTGGWMAAAELQPRPVSAVSESVSTLAAVGAADRWVMTFAFLAVAACDITTGLALRPAATAGRLILIAGGMVGVLVAVSPEPARGAFSLAHAFWAAVGFVTLAVWPLGARRRGPSVPWGLRSAVSVSAAGVLVSLLVWFVAEVIAGGGQLGLAERVLGGMQAAWPLLVVLSCRRNHVRSSAATCA